MMNRRVQAPICLNSFTKQQSHKRSESCGRDTGTKSSRLTSGRMRRSVSSGPNSRRVTSQTRKSAGAPRRGRGGRVQAAVCSSKRQPVVLPSERTVFDESSSINSITYDPASPPFNARLPSSTPDISGVSTPTHKTVNDRVNSQLRTTARKHPDSSRGKTRRSEKSSDRRRKDSRERRHSDKIATVYPQSPETLVGSSRNTSQLSGLLRDGPERPGFSRVPIDDIPAGLLDAIKAQRDQVEEREADIQRKSFVIVPSRDSVAPTHDYPQPMRTEETRPEPIRIQEVASAPMRNSEIVDRQPVISRNRSSERDERTQQPTAAPRDTNQPIGDYRVEPRGHEDPIRSRESQPRVVEQQTTNSKPAEAKPQQPITFTQEQLNYLARLYFEHQDQQKTGTASTNEPPLSTQPRESRVTEERSREGDACEAAGFSLYSGVGEEGGSKTFAERSANTSTFVEGPWRAAHDRRAEAPPPPRVSGLVVPGTRGAANRKRKVTRVGVEAVLYLTRELKALLECHDDSEVSRLLRELGQTVEALPTVRGTKKAQLELDLALQPFRVEDATLRRQLRVTRQQLREASEKLEKFESKDLDVDTFQVERMKGVTETLEKELSKEQKGRLEAEEERDRLRQEVERLKAERRTILAVSQDKDAAALRELTQYQDELTRLRSHAATREAEALKSREHSSQHGEQCVTLRQMVAHREAEIDKLTQVVSGLKQQLSHLLRGLSLADPRHVSHLNETVRSDPEKSVRFEKLLSSETSSSVSTPRQMGAGRAFRHTSAAPEPEVRKAARDYDVTAHRSGLQREVGEMAQLTRSLLEDHDDSFAPALHRDGDKSGGSGGFRQSTAGAREVPEGLGDVSKLSAVSRFSLTDYFAKYPGGGNSTESSEKDRRDAEDSSTDHTLTGDDLTPRKLPGGTGNQEPTSTLGVLRPETSEATRKYLSSIPERDGDLAVPNERVYGQLRRLYGNGRKFMEIDGESVAASEATITSADERGFQEGLVHLDASIERLQRALRDVSM